MNNNIQNINPQMTNQNALNNNQPLPTQPQIENNNVAYPQSINPQIINQNTFNNAQPIQNQTPIDNNAYTQNINPQATSDNSIQIPSQNNFIQPVQSIEPQPQNIQSEDTIQMNAENKFLTPNEFNETSLNDLNVEGSYNNIERTDYSQDQQVRENIEGTKKNTIKITSEMKTFIIIALVLLVFIFIMPYIFDMLRDIKY